MTAWRDTITAEIDSVLDTGGANTAAELRGVLIDLATAIDTAIVSGDSSGGGGSQSMAVVKPGDYGMVSDGTDHTVGFMAMQAAMQDINKIDGKRVVLDLTPNHPTGIWSWDQGTDFGHGPNVALPFAEVLNLTIEGNGSKLYQRNSSYPVFSQTIANLLSDKGNLVNATIAAASAFTSTVTLDPIVVPPAGPPFAVGDWLIITCNSIMTFGSPINVDRYDYARIASYNATTGVIGLDRVLTNDYPISMPDLAYDNGLWGAPRIFRLDYTSNLSTRAGLYTFNTGDAFHWAYDWNFRDLEVLPNGFAGGSTWVFNGLRFKATNCRMPGTSVSMTRTWHTEDCYYWGTNEIDKCISRYLSINDVYEQTFPIQSNSVDDITFINPTFSQGTGCGGKRFSIKGGTGFIGAPGFYGYCRSFLVENFRDLIAGAQDDSLAMSLDGVHADWDNGSIKLDGLGVANTFRVVPGQQMVIIPSSFKFPGDVGIITVMGLRASGGFFYVDTDGPTTWPTWATNSPKQINTLSSANRKYVECTGGTFARNASMASRKGLKTCEFFCFRSNNATWANGDIQGDHGLRGRVKQIEFKVTKLGSAVVAGTTATYSFTPYDSAPPFTDLTGITVTIDLNVLGTRVVDWSGSYGLSGLDGVTGLSSGKIPRNAMIPSTQNWNNGYNPASPTVLRPDQCAIWEISIITDAGILYDLYPDTGGGHSGIPVQIGNVGNTI